MGNEQTRSPASVYVCASVYVVDKRQGRPFVYTIRRDPSLVRSHFKHLPYHDPSPRAFLALDRFYKDILELPPSSPPPPFLRSPYPGRVHAQGYGN